MSIRVVTVFGGTGFLGRRVVRPFDHDLMGRDRQRLGGLHMARNFRLVERGSGPEAGSCGDKTAAVAARTAILRIVSPCAA